ncbi:phage tail family protein [Oceanobacillus oncorhynchi]|uniref:phage tail family protein n=1 Tax=Oceanobacillus oncorhynchi TaxID=545501 RepID=UPI0018671EE9|nr:phage tail family protein [Oceanobacillus oncorhynchi]
MTIIQRHNGETINLDDAGIRTRDFIISAPTYNHQFGEIEGGLGVIDYGTSIGPREITVSFRATSYDIEDFSLLRDEIFNIFRSEESFYLIEHREPGKRWLVKVQNPYSIPQRNIFGNFDITFIGLKGVAESIGTTQDIQRNGINANDELWGFGMGLIADDESLIYTHTGTSFRIFNAGNVAVHPYEQTLKITIDNVRGSSSYLQVRNNTTGDAFRTTEAVSGSQTIVLDGPNVTSNGTQHYRKTNRQFITLAPGWNEFSVTGASSIRVAFDFKYYYK